MVGPPKKKQRREDRSGGGLPQKKFYRQRAHANPFSDHALEYPESPEAMDWSILYPALVAPSGENDNAMTERSSQTSAAPSSRQVEIADIGCGFGGLLFALAPLFPSTLILGMEIRTSVTQFVQEKIKALRLQQKLPREEQTSPSQPRSNESPLLEPPSATTMASAAQPQQHTYDNLACVRANTMKFLPNFFRRGQLSKIFLCFPDPHFKARKHKARIVSPGLAAEYAFVVRPGGKIYTVTDVEDLHLWMVKHFDGFPLFQKMAEEDVVGDACVTVMCDATEESKKVTRNGGKKFVAVFRRKDDPEWS